VRCPETITKNSVTTGINMSHVFNSTSSNRPEPCVGGGFDIAIALVERGEQRNAARAAPTFSVGVARGRDRHLLVNQVVGLTYCPEIFYSLAFLKHF
jgi:hypothetical protein